MQSQESRNHFIDPESQKKKKRNHFTTIFFPQEEEGAPAPPVEGKLGLEVG
jgi:hypothetical protein